MNDKNLVLLWGLIVSVSVFGAYEDVTLERYPDADAVLVDNVTEVAYRADGTYVQTDEQWVKVLTEKGRREESELAVRFNARYGKSTIGPVSVIGTDGVERSVDVSATMKEATDNSSASENIYDPMDRRVTCTIPGVKVGEIIRCTTRRETFKSRVENQYADINLMAWTCPYVRQTIRIKAPAERPLVKTAIRHPLGNVTAAEQKLDDGSILYSWTVTNSPQVFPEPDMPPLYTQVQNLRVSTVGDWRELSKWYWDLCLPHLEKTTPAITNQVETIGHDLEKIYKWVAQEIRYMGLTMEDTSPGYAPHDVNVTFDNRYGVCRDKAGLLVAMLRLAGFDAYPVLIHAGAKMDEEVPLPYFNHAIVAVHAPGDARANKDGYILMDPTDESSRDLLPAYLSGRSYLVARPDGETLLTSQIPSADLNALRIVSKGTLEQDGSLLLDATVDFAGINDNAYRQALLRRKPEDRRKLFERIVRRAAPGAELLACEVSPADLRETESPLGLRLLFRAPETLLRGETRDEFALPMLSRVLGSANWVLEGSTSLESRKFPLDISSTAKVDERIEVALGGAVGPALSLPESVTIDGDYSYSRAFAVKDGTLVATRTLAVNAVEFEPAAYTELRERIKRVEAAERSRPVFSKNTLADANVRIRKDIASYSFTSPTDWTVTNTVEKEILTYDGKKRSSELKFAYNPSWKKVELVSAEVRGPDGKVAKVSEKEMNEFDCGWASSAPRYPASKELIVNLPSVEIGSVIAYTTVTTVRSAPAAFRGVFYFDSYEPKDLVDYRWGDGETERRRVTDVKLLPNEPSQPDALLWRDYEIVAKGDFKTAAENLRPAATVKAAPGECVVEKTVSATERIRAVRDWMAKNVRVAGPALYEVPLAQQLTDPETVLKERYATRLDYVRTLCAQLKAAGLAADIVFAAADADDHPQVNRIDLDEAPNVRMFDMALCRVTVRKGGFLWWGGETKTYYLGTENEYTPIETSVYDGCHFLDPKTGRIGRVEAIDRSDASEETYVLHVRENGSVDVDYEETILGAAVGGFRKRYAEMLPEDRSRHFQELLGALAQAASATRELETDVTGYPATMSFSAFIPDFATVANGAISLSVPAIGANLFPLTGTLRETPVGVGAKRKGTLKVSVVFPEGYTVAEHLPCDYVFAHPELPNFTWYGFEVKNRLDEQGHLVVELTRKSEKQGESHVNRDYFALLKDWSRISASRANRTITVRKAEK